MLCLHVLNNRIQLTVTTGIKWGAQNNTSEWIQMESEVYVLVCQERSDSCYHFRVNKWPDVWHNTFILHGFIFTNRTVTAPSAVRTIIIALALLFLHWRRQERLCVHSLLHKYGIINDAVCLCTFQTDSFLNY